MIKKRDGRMTKRVIVLVSIIIFTFFAFLLNSVSADISSKWYVDTSVYTNLSKEYSSSTLPLAANVDDDPQLEIFYSLGIDSGGGNPTGIHEGAVICLDGLNGSLEWCYNSDGFGRHTTLELGDTDQDGELELVAGGMKNVVCFDAKTGQVEWEYWVDPPYTDDRRKDKHSIILKDTDGETYVFMSGNSNVNEPVIKFAGTDTAQYDPGDIVEECYYSYYTCHGGFACWDIDNDGDFDLFNSDRSTGNGMYWLDTNLTILDSWSSVWCSSHCPTIIDVNEDGYLDVVIADQSTGGVCVIDGQTKDPMSGKWQENIPGFDAHDNNNIYDIDGDGNLELISGDNNKNTGADIFDLGNWQLESYSPLWATTGVGYAHPLAIGNVWQSGNGNETELIGFTSGNSRGYLVIYQWNSSAQDFDILQTLNVYINQACMLLKITFLLK